MTFCPVNLVDVVARLPAFSNLSGAGSSVGTAKTNDAFKPSNEAATQSDFHIEVLILKIVNCSIDLAGYTQE